MLSVMSRDYPVEISDLEKEFSKLSDLTDKIARMNISEEVRPDAFIIELKFFLSRIITWNVGAMPFHVRKSCLSHMSFHREVVADIIAEARSLLLASHHQSLQGLVSYHKQFSQMLQELEMKYGAKHGFWQQKRDRNA